MLYRIKKSRVRSALLLTLVLCLALCGCTPAAPAEVELTEPTKAPASAAVESVVSDAAPVAATPAPLPASSDAAVGRSLYEAALTCDPDAGRIDGQLRLTYYNNTDETLYDLALRLWPNAVAPDSLQLITVTESGVDAYYALDGTGSVMTMPLSADLLPGKTVQIYLEYTLTVPEGEGRFGKSDLGLLLGSAMPVAAMRENGLWRTDGYAAIGDSTYSDVADYKVVVRCPETYRVAASGSVVEANMGSDGVYEAYYAAPEIRDFALALMKGGFEASAVTKSGVTVTAYDKFNERAQYLADTAASAMDYFEERIGPYPYPELTAVGGTLTGGMEYSGFIMAEHAKLVDNDRAMGELFIAHEVAHQWFFGVCGTDQVKEPWVDEALVEFLSMDYIRSVHGETYRAQLGEARYGVLAEHPAVLPMTATLAEFDKAGNNEYFYAVYGRGYELYSAVYEKLGADAFYQTLRTLYADHAFGFLTGDELIAAFSAAAGEDLAPLFAEHQKAAVTSDGAA